MNRLIAALASLGLMLGAYIESCDAQLRHPIRNAHQCGRQDGQFCSNCVPANVGSRWQWLASRSEQHRAVAGLYNRYCVRCHGIDGRGVWDMPDVPNFAHIGWQRSRTDEQLARLTMEGRGAVMPAFRGTFTWDEAWAMARYLRTFVNYPQPIPPQVIHDVDGSHDVMEIVPDDGGVFQFAPPAANPVPLPNPVPAPAPEIVAPVPQNGPVPQYAPDLGEPSTVSTPPPFGFRLSHIVPVTGSETPPAYAAPGKKPSQRKKVPRTLTAKAVKSSTPLTTQQK